ncbi:hypothetical protein DERF_013597 [Dermatophagoides farinae]|uniref:Uncharacterized protein n=1 Tax=Dermatophagoides farinae TaxID=6954 RepID=A0A922HPT8_DERFA|nr:hypothetical protein DERF_013597 [Dermatophagoides farinae]
MPSLDKLFLGNNDIINTERAIKYQRRALPTFNGDIIQFNLFFREFLRIVDGDPALRIDEKFFTLKSMLKMNLTVSGKFVGDGRQL